MKKAKSLTSLQELVTRNPRKDSRLFWLRIGREARSAKAMAPLADRNGLWAVETLCLATADYMAAFGQMRSGEHYKAWCGLERVEIALRWIELNPVSAPITAFATHLAHTVSLWQSLFPYRIFASPAFRHKNWACSICGKKSTPVSPCGHRVGKVYGGQLCVHQITDTEILEISLVRDPVQKYSVLTPDDSEYDFSNVDYVLDRLTGPFHRWTGEWTHRRHAHEQFAGLALSEPCPCASGLRYGECCRPKSGVRLRHFAAQIDGAQAYHEGVVHSGLKPKALAAG